MNRIKGFAATIGAIGFVFATAPPLAMANGPTSFSVGSLADAPDADIGDGDCADADGRCTLRAAFQEAAASGDAIVRLRQGQTYALSIVGSGEDTSTTGDLDVGGSVRVIGNGSTIDLAGLGDRAFDVAAGGSLRVERLSVVNGAPADGESGGAFRNLGSLDLFRVDATANTVSGAGASGGAVLNAGTLVVTGSELSGNSATRAGGAIEATSGATTTVAWSSFAGNRTGDAPGNGGAFHQTADGASSFSNSDFAGNVAANEGGALWNSSVGTMTVDIATFTANAAHGTMADNGGGAIFNQGNADNSSGGDISVRRSTFSDNAATDGSGSGGAILNEGGSLVVDQSTFESNVAARAGGGIETVAGNVAIARTSGITNSAGAAPGNGGFLHVSGPGTVVVERSYFARNAAANEGGALWNSSVGTMTVAHTTLTKNTASGALADNGGGAIFNQGAADLGSGGLLMVANSIITDNSADGAAGSGGGILNEAGVTAVADTRFERNHATRAGGGIETVAGDVELSGVRMIDNSAGAAPGNGGGVHVTGPGVVDVVDSLFRRNDAASEGGALWNSGTGVMTVVDTVISNNSANGPDADNGGGGIFNDGGTLVVSSSRIVGNTAGVGSGSGGGLLSVGGHVDVSETAIRRNVAARAGGAVEVIAGSVDIDRVDMRGNRTGPQPGNGGAVHISGDAVVGIDDSSVRNNHAANEGGGLWNSPAGTMTVTDTDVFRNTVVGGVDGPNVFQQGAAGGFTVDGEVVPEGPNQLEFR